MFVRSDVEQCDELMRTRRLSASQLRLAIDHPRRPLCLAPEQSGETAGSNYRKWDPPANWKHLP